MKTCFFVLLALAFQPLTLVAASSTSTSKISVGSYRSRVIVSVPVPAPISPPVVILVPGGGPQNPELAMAAPFTLDRRPAFLFNQVAEALNQGGAVTLQLGKPGIEFFRSFEPRLWFYDEALYRRLRWTDLIANVEQSIQWVRQQAAWRNSPIYLLGQGEGAQIAVDVAARQRALTGLLLIGYSGHDPATLLDWQLYRREIELFLKPDVDLDRDGMISRAEAARWPEFVWTWQDGVDKVSFEEIETARRQDPARLEIFRQAEESPLYAGGVFRRGPWFARTALLPQDLYVMGGDQDVQTPATEMLKMREACRQRGKKNCWTRLWPYVGHDFSIPRPPRRQPLVDMTQGPVGEPVRAELTQWARSLRQGRGDRAPSP
ncbi:MAG: hypothetical protein KF802_06485 [Bdellovibrionaceae bacterium]|nr:hypothetical protein [Pseudobdellovibrionaceae bacterium]